jgi:WD40 repeat protein
VSVTPDGRRAVSASNDKTLRVWDTSSGKCLNTLEGHTSIVTSVSVNPDGRQAVSASWDKTLRVWDLLTGQCVKTLEGHTSWVRSVSVTPDGRQAVSASDDKTLRVWDTSSGKCLNTLEGHEHHIHSVNVTPDGRLAVSASYDDTLRTWDLSSGKCIDTMTGSLLRRFLLGHNLLRPNYNLSRSDERATVRSVSVTPDGRLAVSASYDNTLWVWDLSSGKRTNTLEGHTGWIYSVSVTPDGRLAVSASADRTLRVWDLFSGKCLVWVLGDALWTAATISSELNLLIGGTKTGQVAIYDLSGFTCSPAIHTLTNSGHEALFSFACIYCGRESYTTESIAKLISTNMKSLEPGQLPCLHLPDSAFSDQRLLMSCPHCNRFLRLNPFYVDMTNHEQTLRRGLEHCRKNPDQNLASLVGHLAALIHQLEQAGKMDEAKQLSAEFEETVRKLAERKTIPERLKKESPMDLRSKALDFYRQGKYAEAETLLRRMLESDFEIPGTRCHLARVQMMTDREADAGQEINMAWENRQTAQPYVIPRILFFQLIFLLLETGGKLQSTTRFKTCLGSLKSALGNDNAHMEWTIQPVLDRIKDRLSEDAFALLQALSAAIDDAANMERLEDFPLWRDTQPEPLLKFINQNTAQAIPVDIPKPHPEADPNWAAELNIQYQQDLKKWKALPWWKRIRTKKPVRLTGI